MLEFGPTGAPCPVSALGRGVPSRDPLWTLQALCLTTTVSLFPRAELTSGWKRDGASCPTARSCRSSRAMARAGTSGRHPRRSSTPLSRRHTEDCDRSLGTRSLPARRRTTASESGCPPTRSMRSVSSASPSRVRSPLPSAAASAA